MLRLGIQSRTWLALLCIFVVIMRISGTHLHFCLDGSEPPESIHMVDDEGFHHPNDEQHSDVDISVAGDALLKNVDTGLDLPLFLTTFFVVFCLGLVLQVPYSRCDFLLPVTAHRAHLRPLLRGPPF